MLYVGAINRIHPRITRALVDHMADVWGESPVWRAMAQLYVPRGPDLPQRIHRAVRNEVIYTPELGEIIRSPGVTLQTRRGDCDDKALLVGALARAHGIDWRPMLLAPDESGRHVGIPPGPLGDRVPFHIWPQLWIGGRWVDCETCHPPEVAHLPGPAWGEHPAAVIERFGKNL